MIDTPCHGTSLQERASEAKSLEKRAAKHSKTLGAAAAKGTSAWTRRGSLGMDDSCVFVVRSTRRSTMPHAVYRCPIPLLLQCCPNKTGTAPSTPPRPALTAAARLYMRVLQVRSRGKQKDFSDEKLMEIKHHL